MSAVRFSVLSTLIVGGILAVALPVTAGNYKPSKSETNGVPDGSLSSKPGNATRGAHVFVEFCGKCHTMPAIGAQGTLGPNLHDDLVSFTRVVTAVREGLGGIQAEYKFAQTCSPGAARCVTFSQVYDVAKFVATYGRYSSPALALRGHY